MASRSSSRKAPLADLGGVRLIALPVHDYDGKSWLAVIEGAAVPMRVRRVFAVFAKRPARRGEHAHRRCAQFMICLKGRVAIGLDDGRRRKKIALAAPKHGLLVPPGIWAEQDYAAGSTLLVLCDRPYEAGDYLRDYGAFLRFRGLARTRKKKTSARR